MLFLLFATKNPEVWNLVTEMVAKNGTAEKLDGGGGSGIGFPVSVQFNSVQSLSCVQLFATPWIVGAKGNIKSSCIKIETLAYNNIQGQVSR